MTTVTTTRSFRRGNACKAAIAPDDELMQAYARGETMAFEQLYHRYRRRLFGYFMINLQNEALAGELFQDVWMKVIAESKRYRQQGRFRSWLFTLAHHRLMDHFRRPEQRYPHHEETEGELCDVTPEGDVVNEEMHALLATMVMALPCEQRQALYLREQEGFSVQELADIQGVSFETAKSRLRYAYRRLREQMANGDPTGDNHPGGKDEHHV
ncbi:MAG: sigma-70 family RNA polymerase sigma factor [Pseudomonadota bacterium]